MIHNRWVWSLTVGAFLLIYLAVAGVSADAPVGKIISKTTLPRPTEEVPLTGCVTAECHPGVKKHEVVHGPVNVDACDACHQLDSAADHTFKPVREKETLCTFCHQMNTKGMAVVHEPIKKGECIGCHDPHGGGNHFLLKAPTANELCKTCHEDVIGDNTEVHGPVASGSCSACHAPHASKYPKLLNSDGPEMCLQCHTSVKTQVETMRVVHGPAAADCDACHEAHASNHKMMLKDEPKNLCLSCHEDIKHTIDTAKTQHGALTTEQSCLNCHDPHASDYPKVLKDDMLVLCFQCHNKEIELPDGKHLANIKAIIESGKSLHGPIAQHNCAVCHQIHGGDNFRMLIKEYPPQFYAPFMEENYALCFSCHERHLVRDEKTTSLTDFRNGDVNLHYLHVNRKTKGRTCRACHETHASNKEHHIRESVPFGTRGWLLPIRYEKLETGGRCSPGCHKPYAYNRDDPVINIRQKKPATWSEPNAPGTKPTTKPVGRSPNLPKRKGATP